MALHRTQGRVWELWLYGFGSHTGLGGYVSVFAVLTNPDELDETEVPMRIRISMLHRFDPTLSKRKDPLTHTYRNRQLDWGHPRFMTRAELTSEDAEGRSVFVDDDGCVRVKVVLEELPAAVQRVDSGPGGMCKRYKQDTAVPKLPDLKVGIIGAGRIGRVHLDTLAGVPGVKPIIISDIVEPVLKEVVAQYGLPAYSLEPMDVINHPEVQAVWICSPSQFHADQIKACAAAGKHVFCEKPIATDLPRTIEAIQVANDAGIKLMTAFQRRFDPSFARLQKAIADGEVGAPVSAVLQSRDPSPPPFTYVKGGGGLFKDMAIHDLDIARWLMGSCGKNEPVKIYATGACHHDKAILELKDSNPSEAIDTANILIEFESGSTATIQVCRKASYGYDQRVEFFGTEGLVRHENVFPNTVEKWSGEAVRRLDPMHNFFMTRYADAYKNETKAFCEMLRSGRPVSPTGDDGRVALEMAMACDLSLRLGRPVFMTEVRGGGAGAGGAATAPGQSPRPITA